MKNLTKALFEIQKELGLTQTKDAKNPFFRSNYLSLPAFSESIQSLFQKHGLLLQQPPVTKDGKTYIETRITHVASGEFDSILTEVVTAKPNDPQALGSGITYMRRFVLTAYLGVAAEDDDGEGAMGRKSKSDPVTKTTTSKPVEQQAVEVSTETKSAPAKKTSSFRKPTETTPTNTNGSTGWT